MRALPPDDEVDFWHNSFKEYLAACEVNDEHREGDLMIKHELPMVRTHSVGEDDAWTEVRHWACAVMGTGPASTVVNWLMDQAEGPDDPHLWRREALICGDYATSLDESTNHRLSNLVDTMLVGANSDHRTHIQAWKRVGESALRFLNAAIAGAQGPAKQVAAARIAAAIGGDDAVNALASLPDSVKAAIASDLLAMWRLDPTSEATLTLLNFETSLTPTPAILRTTTELLSAAGIGPAYSPHVWLGAQENVRNLLAEAPIALHPRIAHVRDLSLIELIGLLRYTQGAKYVHATNLRGLRPGLKEKFWCPSRRYRWRRYATSTSTWTWTC